MGNLDQILQDVSASVVQASGLWKAIAFFFFWVILWIPIAIPIARLLNYQPFKPLKVEQKLPLLASLYLIAPVIIWGVAKVESRSFSDYGLKLELSVLVSLGLGFIFGVLGLAVVFGMQRLLGWQEWHFLEETSSSSTEVKPKNWLSVVTSILLPTLLIGLLIAGIEELIFRGFLLNQLQQDYPNWVAAVLSSLIFALLHLVWEQQETLPQLPGLWLMGMVLVLARWVDGGSLGLAWGLHAGWIWAIASLDTIGLITYTGIVPAWITGIAAKPLAGAIGIIYIFITGLALWLFFK